MTPMTDTVELEAAAEAAPPASPAPQQARPASGEVIDAVEHLLRKFGTTSRCCPPE